MKSLLAGCDVKQGVLAPQLSNVLAQGLIHSEGCIILKSQMELVSSEVRKRFTDKTGFECFVNHIHVEDYAPGEMCILLQQSMAFGKELERTLLKAGVTEPVQYIIAGDTDEMNIRFHVLREGEEWLAQDIERYEEAVAVVRISGDGGDGDSLRPL
jgi:hypothetical protein